MQVTTTPAFTGLSRAVSADAASHQFPTQTSTSTHTSEEKDARRTQHKNTQIDAAAIDTRPPSHPASHQIPPPLKPQANIVHRHVFDDIIEIVVGIKPDDTRTFKVHKSVICFYSGNFERTWKGRVGEEGEDTVNLPDEGIDISGRFVSWLYTRRIDDDEPRNSGVLCDLWALGDRREVPLLMNECINAMRDKTVTMWVCPVFELAAIYDSTIPDSGLRPLALRLIGEISGPSLLVDEHYDRWPKAALWDVLREVWSADASKRLTKDTIGQLDLCQFHQHEKGVTCQKPA